MNNNKNEVPCGADSGKRSSLLIDYSKTKANLDDEVDCSKKRLFFGRSSGNGRRKMVKTTTENLESSSLGGHKEWKKSEAAPALIKFSVRLSAVGGRLMSDSSSRNHLQSSDREQQGQQPQVDQVPLDLDQLRKSILLATPLKEEEEQSVRRMSTLGNTRRSSNQILRRSLTARVSGTAASCGNIPSQPLRSEEKQTSSRISPRANTRSSNLTLRKARRSLSRASSTNASTANISPPPLRDYEDQTVSRMSPRSSVRRSKSSARATTTKASFVILPCNDDDDEEEDNHVTINGALSKLLSAGKKEAAATKTSSRPTLYRRQDMISASCHSLLSQSSSDLSIGSTRSINSSSKRPRRRRAPSRSKSAIEGVTTSRSSNGSHTWVNIKSSSRASSSSLLNDPSSFVTGSRIRRYSVTPTAA